MIYFSQLEKITRGKITTIFEDKVINTLCIDSRKVTDPEGTLFFAIKGDRHDGHRYINALYRAGVRMFVVEDAQDTQTCPEAAVIQVHSSVNALQQLTVFHRNLFNIPVIGITGSNGKTIIKEWLYQILSKDKVVVKNPGSYNSQVGVPLSVWQIRSHHEMGVFEAGVSRPGEMENLEKIIQPSIGIFTNIGPAHSEGFKDQEEKIREKLTLFRNTSVLIYCRDQEPVQRIISQSGIKTLSWGTMAGADIQVAGDGGSFNIAFRGEQQNFSLPFTDKASQENCLHCVATLLYLGYTLDILRDRVTSLRSVPMRMELKEGVNQCQVIDDTYNNDLGGLEIALQFLSHQHQKKKKRLILSDILESGMPDEKLAGKISFLVHQYNVTAFVGIGPVLSNFPHVFPATSKFFSSTDDFLKNFDLDQLHEEVILVKGARTFAFEKIVSRLQRKVHGTVMEIDLDSLVHNLNFFKARLKPTTKVMVMVKAFAYGSGSTEIANILQYHKADYLGVAYADEGVELRKNNITLPIMVMNPSEESFDTILQYKLEPEIYSVRILSTLLQYLQGKPCRVHIKLDTGMHRLGFEQDDIDHLISLLGSNPSLQVASIFSHLAGADEAGHDAFSHDQFDTFLKRAGQITTALGYRPLYHILNSPGILRLPELQLDMVRLGIGLYGVDPTHDGFKQLQPVATLKTIISQIKQVRAGESIGYGRKGRAERDTTIATIAIGYADGYSRAFSRGNGVVLVRGKRAPVIGNVCMDMTMIDITGLEANEGDEVIIFGKAHPIQDVAASIHTIAYEILTSTSERVKRVFVAEGI